MPGMTSRRRACWDLPSTGKKGGPVFLRYRAADRSGTVFVEATVSWPGNEDDGDLTLVHHAGSFSVTRRYRLGREALGPGETLPATFRFCIVASDPSGNRSNMSCNTYQGG
jgi:hypothetical protein